MCSSKGSLKQLVAVATALLMALAAKAQIFTGSISFVGGADLDNPIGSATTFVNFYGPSGSGGPVVQAGSLTSGVYASVPGGTPATFTTPFTFSPSPASPLQLWTFTVGGTTYSFNVNSVTTDIQNVYSGGIAYLNVGGTGIGYVTGYSPTQATWSITGTTANSSSLTITIGSSVNAVPEPSALALALVGLVICGVFFRRQFKPALSKAN